MAAAVLALVGALLVCGPAAGPGRDVAVSAASAVAAVAAGPVVPAGRAVAADSAESAVSAVAAVPVVRAVAADSAEPAVPAVPAVAAVSAHDGGPGAGRVPGCGSSDDGGGLSPALPPRSGSLGELLSAPPVARAAAGTWGADAAAPDVRPERGPPPLVPPSPLDLSILRV
ncbi:MULTISPECIES: hypothetical protein [Streptomyces]|uniref:hypothetical protein n=1 Tax=Streptomyces TaxID=1883 RepID=UPI0007CD9AC1|nr:hypothetical protein A4V12_27285 [Streptomyces noursei]